MIYDQIFTVHKHTNTQTHGTLIFYIYEDSSQKEHHHGEAVRLIPLHRYDIFSLPLAGTSSRWTGQRQCRRILFNYVNRLRKELINTLIYLISFFNCSPPNLIAPKLM